MEKTVPFCCPFQKIVEILDSFSPNKNFSKGLKTTVVTPFTTVDKESPFFVHHIWSGIASKMCLKTWHKTPWKIPVHFGLWNCCRKTWRMPCPQNAHASRQGKLWRRNGIVPQCIFALRNGLFNFRRRLQDVFFFVNCANTEQGMVLWRKKGQLSRRKSSVLSYLQFLSFHFWTIHLFSYFK